MFGFKLVREEDYKELVECTRRHCLLVAFGYWFHETPTVRELLVKFMKGEVDGYNIETIRKEFVEKLGVKEGEK